MRARALELGAVVDHLDLPRVCVHQEDRNLAVPTPLIPDEVRNYPEALGRHASLNHPDRVVLWVEVKLPLAEDDGLLLRDPYVAALTTAGDEERPDKGKDDYDDAGSGPSSKRAPDAADGRQRSLAEPGSRRCG